MDDKVEKRSYKLKIRRVSSTIPFVSPRRRWEAPRERHSTKDAENNPCTKHGKRTRMFTTKYWSRRLQQKNNAGIIKMRREPETEPTMLNGILTEGTKILHIVISTRLKILHPTYSLCVAFQLGVCLPF
ncbi:hypothetical protein PsorP6_000560 [Peronosclerospora sorghi]|uniref:Uncharacterized protein n=1 Tax=Peronosclerospora sorghi TaxID=230839 RepID=A0ACC0WTT7_9STRA|nr:hypothetical protein PsorP6_000560 [Peronosclerospora sorghi]